MSIQNIAIVERWTAEMWTRGQLEVAEEIFASDAIDHDALPGQSEGAQGFAQGVAMFRAAFPDLEVTNEDLFANGDKVVVRWTARATHEGELMGVAPTGNAVTLKGIDILRIADGKIVERWGEWDGLGLMTQIGAAQADGA